LGSEPRIQVREPVQVTSDGPWLVTTAGQNHTCGIRSDASLWCWGDNTASVAGEGYPLGIVGVTQVESPTRVGAASDWETVHTNTFHSCALNRNHELWCWGRNVEGQLGTGDVIGRESPTRVTSDVALVSAGRFSTCAITTDGQPRCTGMNEDGQLGTGDVDRRQVLTPVRLDTP
jgi:alpha-tubulin suppressor-like RCC1 family protein